MAPVSASKAESDGRPNLNRLMGWVPAWAHDHPLAWQTLYVVSFAAQVAMVLTVWHIVRDAPPDWAQIAGSTGAVSVVLALLYVVPHRNGRS